MFRRSAVALSAWRDQGVSYLKYLNVATEALHGAVKESKAAKYKKFSENGFQAQVPDGQGSFVKIEKVPDQTSKY